ncbi:MAG TPA: pyridoxamine 5'-phosphate oxidase family protein [Anaerolineae bacterium]|nr:pyridoxamine 5'-phosphate oxidase family protein [Anaerolineae bacterium]
MPTSKRAVKQKPISPETGPAASRPYSPGRAYGIPQDKKGLLPWSHVAERMAQAHAYWICTVSPEGWPHATPVDGVWLDDRLYFGGSPETRRNRNLAANPAVCIHLESGSDVVILHGEAHEFRASEPALATRLSGASAQKYGYGLKPEEYATATGMYVFRPRVVFAWKQFPKDATRWDFPNEVE